MVSTQLIQFIFGLSALIFIHELGHFIAARILKVEVDEFGIGFPPRALKLFEYKGTIYSINWLPLGGFVKPKGENDPSIPGGLAAASPWVRLGVLFAGPAMNIFLGILLGVVLFYNLGNPIADKVLVQYVDAGSPAEAAGLRAGDLFVSFNDQTIDSAVELQELIAENVGNQSEIVYERDGKTYTITLVPRVEYPQGQGPIGIGITNPTEPVSLTTALSRGVGATFEYVRALLVLPVRMLQGQATPDEGRLLGYKGMFDIYRYIQSPLWFFMAISISLGIINLFPIPALDGGRILLTLPEILFRRRIPSNYENTIHMVGFTLLILLLIYINLQDFLNPIQLP